MSRSSRLVAVVLAALPAWSAAGAVIVAPDQAVNGISQAELSARWWQWGVSFPEGSNPITDTTGEFAYLGADQAAAAHPGIFFLAGNLGTPSTRTVVIPEGQFIYIPIIPIVSPAPFFGNTEAELRADAAATIGTASDLFVRIDGVDASVPPPTTSLLDFRQLSPPGLFDLVIPPDNIFGVDPGSYPSVTDGYYVVLEPLAAGSYELTFGGTASGTPGLYPPFSNLQTYRITVQAVPEPSALALSGLGGLILLGRIRSRRRFA